MSSSNVRVLGEVMAAVRLEGPIMMGGNSWLGVAGSEATVGVALSRLGHRVAMESRVGDDELGLLVMRSLAAEQIILDDLSFSPSAPTGLMIREQRVGLSERVYYYRQDSAFREFSLRQLQAAEPTLRLIHTSGITAAVLRDPDGLSEGLRAARSGGVLTSFDLNYRSRLWSRTEARRALRSIVEHVDVLFASDAELDLLASRDGARTEETVDSLLSSGVSEVVVRRGSDGASGWSADGSSGDVSAVPVSVRSLVGAGDGFTGGYLSSLLRGEPLSRRLQLGARVAAFVVSHHGDWEGLPYEADLDLLAVSNDVVR